MKSSKSQENKLPTVFITGTDTDIGKTVITGLLAKHLLQKGFKTITQKWTQTGCVGFSEDIAAHLKMMGVRPIDIEERIKHLCPCMFELPASPHLSAKREGKRIDPRKIRKSYSLLKSHYDTVIVEGAGGALVPYNNSSFLIDIAIEMKLPILVVAGNKLGAINHTLLTIEALRSRKADLIGVVFNDLSEERNKITEDNPDIVKKISKEKVFGHLPFIKSKKKLCEAFEPIGNQILEQLKARG